MITVLSVRGLRMKKTIKNYRITVTGETDEIRNLILNVGQELGRGAYKSLEEEVEHLEKISDPEQYTFGQYVRIYFSKDTFLYVPNVSEKAKEFHFNIFKPIFDRAYENTRLSKPELCGGCDVPSMHLQYGNNGKQYCPRCKEEVSTYGIKF